MNATQRTICAGLVLAASACGGTLRAEEPSREFALGVNAANATLRGGDVDGAIKQYGEMRSAAPESADLSYNMAVAQFRKGEVAAAAPLFEAAAASENDTLAASARYNLGNCNYTAGLKLAESDRKAAIEELESAIDNYRSSLAVNTINADARTNIELAAQLIEKLRQEQKQQDQQQNQQKQQDQKQQQSSDEQQNNQQQQGSQGKQDEQQQKENQQKQDQQQQEQNKEQQSSDEQQKNQQQKNEQQQNSQSESSQNDKEKQRQQQEQQKQDQQKQDQQSAKEQNADQQKQEQENHKQKQEQNEQSPQEQRKSQSQRNKQQNQSAQQQQQPQQSPQDAGNPEEQKPEQQGQKPPQGELSATNEEAKPGDEKREAVAFDPAKDGEMTQQEAEKMLQAIRDRDLIRRYNRQKNEQQNYVPVDRDW